VTRLFSDAELSELARSPRSQLALALEESPDTTREVFERLAGRHLRFTEGYTPWLSAIREFLETQYGKQELEAADASAERLQAAYPSLPDQAVDTAQIAEAARSAAARVASGHADAALSTWDALAEDLLAHHDAERDRVSLYLSHLYQAHGPDALESCHRFCAERTLLQWMPRDLSRDPASRLRVWAGIQLGNFSRLSIEEDDEKFTIRQHPCGTCSRQIEAGANEPPLNLAIIEEAGPLSFGVGGVPVYRSHVAVFHYLLPMEQNGVPWPVIRCPLGVGTETCRVLIYKDPRRTPPEHAREMGMPLEPGPGLSSGTPG